MIYGRKEGTGLSLVETFAALDALLDRACGEGGPENIRAAVLKLAAVMGYSIDHAAGRVQGMISRIIWWREECLDEMEAIVAVLGVGDALTRPAEREPCAPGRIVPVSIWLHPPPHWAVQRRYTTAVGGG